MRSELTRREFGQLTLAALAFPQMTGGVPLGVQTYSFRDLPRTPDGDAVAGVIQAMRQCGLAECELWAEQVEPPFSRREQREELRKWRLETPLDHFRRIGQAFKDAGITIYAFNYSPSASFTDAEIDRGFEMAKALGAQIITASTQVDTARRIAPFAETHEMIVAMHNHSKVTDPNEFATPESFAAAMKLSRYFKVNLDIGHFVAGDGDPIAYMREHHANITNLHLKDRKRHQGDNTPWGQGDTPIAEVLQLLKREAWPIRAYIEYEYRGAGTPVEEVTTCLAYAKAALV